ncbi:MAG TPA: flagellar biosynthesis protein FlhF [Leptospiraceae bacterium]|nr:flagellar biosynthesis protein FlhF [Leptospiraceae bacterium]
MDFVKIRGKDIQDCFMQMKMKYGPEAHVYEQRIVTEGGIFGTGFLAKKYVEIEIGVPEQQSSKEKVEKKLQDLKELLKQKSEEEGPKKKTLTNMKPLLQREKEKENSKQTVKDDYISDDFLDNDDEEEDYIPPSNLGLSIKDELTKKESVSASAEKEKSSQIYESVYLKRMKDKLVRDGFSNDYAEEVISKADKYLSYVDKAKSSAVNEKVMEILEERIGVDADLFSSTGRGKRKVIFLIGPTGSGKTTTIAKLAAKYFLHMGRMVSLYTTDNYRIAAIEQLKRYADTMEIPFYPVKDLRKFKENLLRDGAELILIDTAGYNHRNSDFYLKMEQYREAFSDKDQVENILVMSSTIASNNMKSVLEAYDKIGYKRVILTKIDEAESLNSALELADTHNKLLSYFSIGQEVPFDIIPATKKMLAELVIFPEKIKEIKGETFSVSS